MRHPECCAEDWRQKLRSAPGLVGLLRRKLVHTLLRKRLAIVLPRAYAMRWRLQVFVGMQDGAQWMRPAVLSSFGLFHVWFDACWDAGCVCWHPFIAHTCANWQLSDLQVPVWNLRARWPRRFWTFLFPCLCLSCAAARIFAAGWRAVWAAWDSGGPV